MIRVCSSCKISFSSETNIPKSLKKKFWWVEENFCCYACLLKVHHFKKTTRSKSEEFIYESIRERVRPDIRIFKNDRKQIGYELDIYIPKYKIAIEVNGPVHRENIYGKENLKKVQKNDKIRSNLCINKGITLFIINISYVKNKSEADKIVDDYFKENRMLNQLL